MKTAILFFFFFLTIINVAAQFRTELGAEYIRSMGKGYNHAKAALRGESFNGSKNSFSAGITYQLGSKKAYSVSHGFGVYIGYRYSFSVKTVSSAFAGARVLFSLENFEGQTRQNSVFFTPWAEAGYHIGIGKRYYAAPSLGFGKTFKFSKDYHSLDEDNGPRLMPSVSAGYRF